MQVDLPEKRYYKIGEVAKAFGVNTSLIRFWEKEFDVIKPKKMQRETGCLPKTMLKIFK
jgi:transposase-like protein